MDFVIHGFLMLKLHRPLSGMVQTKQALLFFGISGLCFVLVMMRTDLDRDDRI